MTGVSQALAGVENVSVTLSGGLDSRAVLHCAHALGKPIRAYSFGLPRCRDLVFARRQAEILGVPLTAVEVDGSFLPAWLRFGVYQTGGMIGCMHFHILALAERLAGSELVLDGQGGDAWTGAHLKGPMFRRGNVESAARRLHRMRASGWNRPSKWDSLLQPDLGQAVRRADPLEAVRGHLRGLAPADRWKGCHAFDILERQRRFIQFGPHLLQPMTHVAIPFCSNAFVEAAASLSPRELLGQRAYIAMHVEYLRDLAGVPDSARGLPLTVPRPIRFAKKVYDHAARRSRRLPIFPRGLRAPTTDYANWFRASLNPLLRERLLDGAPILHDVFRPEALQLLVSEHESGRADHGSKFGCLIALSVWRDLLKSPPPAIPASLSVSC
jgi:asparagine synthase (glutamine-hydrolysing)